MTKCFTFNLNGLCQNCDQYSRDPITQNGIDHVTNTKSSLWTIDTGACEHITRDKSLLSNFVPNKMVLRCANNTTCTFEGYGTFHGIINNFPVTLNRVLYSKNVNKNLISGIKLASEGILFSTGTIDNKTFVKLSSSKDNSTLGYFYNQDNIIRIPILQGSNNLSNLEDNNNSDLQLWITD